jgi:hypothetical protein
LKGCSTKDTKGGDRKNGTYGTYGTNVDCIRDIRYYWFADGYPITYGASNTLKISTKEAGTEIRCMVKAVGACSMPEGVSAENVELFKMIAHELAAGRASSAK